jgi:ATPase family protein associated with various cellular activities (AAA)/winged helix domain-containing protein
VSSATGAPLDWFAYLQQRLRLAVQEAVAAGNDPDDSLRGLYISDEQALALSSGASATPPAAALREAAERLGLDELDSSVLALCAAPELHPRFGRLYAYLQDDVTRRLASPRLAADLLSGDGVAPSDVLACFSPGAPLERTGAVRMPAADATATLADRPVKVADRLAAFLLGAGALGAIHGGVRLRRVEPQPATGREDSVQRIALLLAARTRLPLVVCGPDAGAIVACAAAAPLVLLGARELDSRDAVADARLSAALTGAQLTIDGLEDLTPAERAQLLAVIDESPERLVLIAGSARHATALSDRAALIVEVPYPSFAERRQAWEQFTGMQDTHEVAAKFRLSVEQIRAAAEVSLIAASSRGAERPESPDLDLGARQASSSRLGELASHLGPGYAWDDLVLPERPLDLLRSISAYLRHRDRVLSEWGYEATVSRTQGLKVLFAGESGTGKTMAAQVLGAQLGLDLFRVDLATIVSKYIGETEKNLERIFTAAHGSNAILFFDEADALFGKRSEVSDSHDRYANIEVAYLLQRMEAYPGAVILATNFRRNIDDAFVRRLDFVIDFPFPEAEDRRRIWRLVLPRQAPVAADVDFDFLATRFKLSGGAIRNCSLAAAFRAADEGSEIEMRHLVGAVAQEYAKQGRLTLESDFDRFHAGLRATGSPPTGVEISSAPG